MSYKAGAAEVDITPTDSQFLFGYPHVERYSTGVHDPLLSSALVISDGSETIAFVANDIIYVDKAMVARVRDRIQEQTSILGANVFVSATHTHSGPKTLDHLSNREDPMVPSFDPSYRQRVEDGIVTAVCEARANMQDAQIGFSVADGAGVGTNRRDPSGPADLDVPVLSVRSTEGAEIACMVVCAMHPTVLHEDSTLVSSDFPGATRTFVKREAIGTATPFLYHTGTAGNQSPRHVTRSNTFEEADRLGAILGSSIVSALERIEYETTGRVAADSSHAELPLKSFPPVAEAKDRLEDTKKRLEALRARDDVEPQTVRTAEVDWFGAEETLTLARADEDGTISAVASGCVPAEVMVVTVGPLRYVGLPGELFVEYGLAIRSRCDNTFVVSLANGELQGYVVTEEAVAEGGYEASNAIFDHSSGRILVDIASGLLGCV